MQIDLQYNRLSHRPWLPAHGSTAAVFTKLNKECV